MKKLNKAKISLSKGDFLIQLKYITNYPINYCGEGTVGDDGACDFEKVCANAHNIAL